MLSERYSCQAQKFLRRMDFEKAINLIDFLKKIQTIPLSRDAVRTRDPKHRESIFEIWKGDIRVLYEINFQEKLLLIHAISRKDLSKLKENFEDYYY